MLSIGKRVIIILFFILTMPCVCCSANHIEDSLLWKLYYPVDMVWTYHENHETRYIALTKADSDDAINYVLLDLSNGSKKFLIWKSNILYLTKEEDYNKNEIRKYLPYKPIFVPPLKKGQTWSWESQIFVNKISEDNMNSCTHIIKEKGYTTVLGEETIEVPAGSFKCKKLKTKVLITSEDESKNYIEKTDRWYAKNIGLIEEKSLTFRHQCAVGGECELINFRLCQVHESDLKELSKRKVAYCKESFLESVKKNDIDIVKLFLNAGMDPNVEGDDNMTALHYAADKGFKQIVNLLILNKANVNAMDKFSQTPIIYAAKNDDKEIIKLLISSGANVNIKSSKYDAPIIPAACCNDIEILKLLISSGADVNAGDMRDMTALHFAVERGHKEAAELLISSGADVNAKDAVDYTPLHSAIFARNKEMVELLISSGANVNAKNLSGATPLYWAKKKGFEEIVNLLRKNGAKE